ncbi:hypothetical protein CBR_g68700 [Chara braunii]|uniref:DUF4360 domain-containing protein n=1 Tax=Chara braunii TaxID=69332 RepID=A0A388K9L6_CHABU|nr:hypothetical protein CBR_g68700 [Chara braunii]|eukprot:GBG66716.1 hypothetical protein CBR_g68700 [Chara braunii]
MQKGFRSFSPMAAMATLLLLTILQLAVHGSAQAPPPGTVTIDGVSYAGDGCPSGSVAYSVSDDFQALTVMYSSYTATTDQGLLNTRKRCTLTIKLNYPPGFFYTLGTVTVRGYTKLDAKVKGTVRVTYHVSGRVGSGAATYNFYGPTEENFERTESFANGVSSECGRVRDLNIVTEGRVHPGKPPKTGIITVDSTDLKLTEIYSIKWNKC